MLEFDGKTCFKNYKNSSRVPLLIYAYFKYLLKNINTCQPDPEKSSTNNQKYDLISLSYYIKYNIKST